MKKKFITFIGLVLVVAGSIQAASVSVTNAASVAMQTEQDTTVSLAKFDDSLGTLTQIYIEFVTQISNARVQLDNDSTGTVGARGNAACGISYFVTAANLTGTDIADNGSGLAIFKQSSLISLSPTSGDATNVFNATGQGDYYDWNPGIVKTKNSGLVDSGSFADYIGSGSFDTTINSSLSTGASIAGGYFIGNSPVCVFSAKVIYTYSQIPEPATASLSVLVILVAVWIRRRFID